VKRCGDEMLGIETRCVHSLFAFSDTHCNLLFLYTPPFGLIGWVKQILATQSANDLTEHIAGGLSREETNGIITETQRDDEDGGEIEEWGDELRENDGSNSKG